MEPVFLSRDLPLRVFRLASSPVLSMRVSNRASHRTILSRFPTRVTYSPERYCHEIHTAKFTSHELSAAYWISNAIQRASRFRQMRNSPKNAPRVTHSTETFPCHFFSKTYQLPAMGCQSHQTRQAKRTHRTKSLKTVSYYKNSIPSYR